jgi:hypothetical protein
MVLACSAACIEANCTSTLLFTSGAPALSFLLWKAYLALLVTYIFCPLVNAMALQENTRYLLSVAYVHGMMFEIAQWKHIAGREFSNVQAPLTELPSHALVESYIVRDS